MAQPKTTQAADIIALPAAPSAVTAGYIDQLTERGYLVRVGAQRHDAVAASGVEPELLASCLAHARPVIVTLQPRPTIIGAVQTSLAPPSAATTPMRAELGGQETVTLRAGKAAITLHADGTIELAGQRLKVRGQSAIDMQGGVVKLS